MRSPLRNSRTLLLAALGLASAAGFSAFYMWRLTPAKAAWLADQRHEEQLTTANQSARRDLATMGLERMQRVLQELDRQAGFVSALTPPDSVRTPLLPVLNAKADEAHIRILETSPLPAEREGAFVRDGYAVRAVGRYHEMGTFLAALLTLPRITQLRNPELVAVRLQGDTTLPAAQRGPVAWGVTATFQLVEFSVSTKMPADSTTGPGRKPIEP